MIESVSFRGPSATIKTHHNVGGLPLTMQFKLIEPLRELFKDEVRRARRAARPAARGRVAPAVPGPGLAIRVLGEVTPERLDLAARGRRHRPGGGARRLGYERTGLAGVRGPRCPIKTVGRHG